MAGAPSLMTRLLLSLAATSTQDVLEILPCRQDMRRAKILAERSLGSTAATGQEEFQEESSTVLDRESGTVSCRFCHDRGVVSHRWVGMWKLWVGGQKFVGQNPQQYLWVCGKCLF